MKRLLAVAVVAVVVWVCALGTDYWRTIHGFAKPAFAVCAPGVDDGGSGTYKGVGYMIVIKGDFMPEDEFPGVTRARFMMFGKQIKAVIRD